MKVTKTVVTEIDDNDFEAVKQALHEAFRTDLKGTGAYAPGDIVSFRSEDIAGRKWDRVGVVLGTRDSDEEYNVGYFDFEGETQTTWLSEDEMQPFPRT